MFPPGLPRIAYSRLNATGRRLLSTGGPKNRREFKVVLDNETLYVEQPLAEALGWKPEEGHKSVPLTFSGWSPHYFAIARTTTDSDLLARGTVESSHNLRILEVLEYLKDR
ncbi:uncharacterized protein LAESUDRAFT_691535 [Laetiporus sulphureus 93-53]|uniref:Uncharacterized protein n=1 Tax=Laetiporus sulphureus 93-53 TaxID=1314785 RepID=A0A165HW98_9APHY|nr:uncharacterized protein LAESUDRAFT_691535 [Laetiporus sulphureus 93-53]KZT12273.1 hypothetical protein LAESUDRAFT_691535 [Laetiporus sulphureus 93-53]